MDPLTHAASGAALMLAIPRRPLTFLAAPLAALACASPDIDLAFIHTPLEFLLLHRGITHSFAFMPFFAVLLALICWPLWRKKTPFAWKFHQVWLFCCLMLLLHIWLDVVTTYGTMVFLPFSHYRVRLNSLYIVDPAITLPLLWAICFWRKKPKRQLGVLIWIFLLPGVGIGLNQWHEAQLKSHFLAEGRNVDELHVLPDAFAPLFWRAIYRESTPNGPIVTSIGLNWLGRPENAGPVLPGMDSTLKNRLMAETLEGDVFFNFALTPAMLETPAAYLPEGETDNTINKMCYDLRFGSNIPWVEKLLNKRPDADLPFLFFVELSAANPPNFATGPLERVRMRFTDSGRDSYWHKPVAPTPPTFWQWLVGLR